MNYQKELDGVVSRLESVPKLLLHDCCAPCGSYCIEYLSKYFDVTVYFYNPNISPREEYIKRVNEIKRLISQMPLPRPVHFMEGQYNPQEFFNAVKGYENEPEGGKRCEECFKLRLFDAAIVAKENNFDYFTTTLTISPLKNAELLNEIGSLAAEKCGVKFLPSDFKKRGGYQRSIALSREYNLYRQNFCGCVYSKKADTV